MVNVHVQDIIEKAYDKCSYIENRSAFENKCYEDAIKRLEPEDRAFVEGIAKTFDHSKASSKKKTIRLHNFGKASALELTAKLGIFLNAVNYKGS